ncbi:protein NPAT-like isoform X2 [Sinocyclocheilus rhinocerous]|uniref:protein NPAT-like isoform X2 n=1 Tax=Sinocyclocheilus rhinocerous TaxID=307959 RepID=UPI0007B86760|nr:PREDICTED: protein NPAT-like isoform X2 [Sinocyclocheilus rhinocerous]
MLLPSDVARLVLGYLQQEGLTATSRAFIYESPNLKEYAEHSSEDGVIPACVFSLFGKNLITILNEYVAVKAKETSQENQIPAVMTSLWKKLDFTLNQIKSLQNSPAVQLNQRLRTMNSIQNMRRQQRPLLASQSPITGHPPLTPALQCVPSTLSTPQGMLGHSTPVSYTSQHTRPSTLCLSQPGESPLQILVPDNRLNPGPLSPARRKCDSPRRRGGGQLCAIGTNRATVVSSTLVVESQNEETVTENLSQIVIENAREKILNDRFLQEKLAENINKILASDNTCSAVEQEQSIDEILGLQGEIHMTDDAIQDILAQTESDPAFQALFDLFDYGKSNTAECSEQADGSFSTSTSAQESDETGHVDSASETATGQENSTSGGESSAPNISTQSESKTKTKSSSLRNATKSASTAPQPRIVTKQTGRGSTNSKRGIVRTRVLSSNKQSRSATSTSPSLNNKADSRPPDQIVSSSSLTEEGVGMEIDEPENETSESVNIQLVPLESLHANETLNDNKSSQVPISTSQTTSTTETSNNASVNEPGRVTGITTGQNDDMGTSLSIQSETVPSLCLPQPDTDTSAKTASLPSSNKTPLTPSCIQTQSNTVRSNLPASGASSTATTPCISEAPAREPDPSKIVSLKIIISDEQDEVSADVALNQAVSSITSDHIPTIFLSSPAKSPSKTLPATSAVITLEETAQAVSCLQGAEGVGSFRTPTRSTQSCGQPALGRPAGQETGFIQLLQANPSFGPSSSYIIVTEPAAAEQRSNVVLLPSNVPQGTVSSMPHMVVTPPRQRTVVSMGANVSQTYSPGSTIIISSPVQPMLQNVMLPVSVMGQNTGKLTVLPNQMLTLPCSATVRQPVKVISQHKLAPKENTDMGKTSTSGSGQVLPQASEQQKSVRATSPSHRRILCFDVTPETTSAGQNSLQTSTLTSSAVTSSAQQVQKEITQTEPKQPLVSDTCRRRIETVRLPEINPKPGIKDSEKVTIFHQQKEAPKCKMNEKGLDLIVVSSTKSSNKAAIEPEALIRPESLKKSQASQKEDGGVVPKSSAPGPKQKPAGNTKDGSQEEASEKKELKPAERSSGKTSLQNSPGVTANKENELESCQRQTSARPTEDLAPSTAKSTVPVSSMSSKTLCKTSPLTKQAVEMLQDIQGQAPVATPPKRRVAGCPDLPLPRTPEPGCAQEELTDGLRTPSQQRLRREGESTPRHLPPPTTPDIPSCSPASEAGSENSINMAAHTLMILSRAARTGGPLKDSLRQEEASAGKSAIPKGKKRKQIEPSPPAKKELQLSSSSSSKKKSKKQKKLLDSFPEDLDVDKFLSSLHYDE